jgi:dTMP kinase
MSKAKFITFEGMDGAGKSTHLAWFAETLRGRGVDVLVTREPGGTPLGERLREILLNQPMHAETEALLMFAARREHIEQVIRPALSHGTWVISDRFSDASFAYQGGGRGLSVDKLEQLEQWTHGGFQPDLTLLFDIPVEIARRRLSNNQSLDRFEQEQAMFFEKVRQAYLDRYAKSPQRFALIDAAQSLERVKASLERVIQNLFA